ncbi:PPP4R2-domain-containing protein [Pavlovales sp. CCMP2436]|nr:PPP4R2-domain-containing protein [Pavlovales sp. CCMP2436]
MLDFDPEAALAQTSATGQPALPWPLLKQIVALRLRKVLGEYYERSKDCDNPTRQTEFGEWRDRILELLGSFQRAPFTLQRLCELLLNPQQVYRSTRKLMSAVEKLLMVTTTISGAPSASEDQSGAGGQPGSRGAGGESGTSMLSQRNEPEGNAMPMDIDAE